MEGIAVKQNFLKINQEPSVQDSQNKFKPSLVDDLRQLVQEHNKPIAIVVKSPKQSGPSYISRRLIKQPLHEFKSNSDYLVYHPLPVFNQKVDKVAEKHEKTEKSESRFH